MRISDWSSDVCSSDLQVKKGVVTDAQIFMNAEYYQSCQYHDRSRSLLVQWNVTSIPVEDHLKAIVEDTLWGKLQVIGFIIPRAEWEQKYPEQVADRTSTRLNSRH